MAVHQLVLTAIQAVSMMVLGGTTQTEPHATPLDVAIAFETVTLALAISGIGRRPRRLSEALEDDTALTAADLLARIGREEPLPRGREPDAPADVTPSPSWLSPHAPRRPGWREIVRPNPPG